MKVKQFIREFGWDALSDRGIEVRKYDDGNRVLNYSQIDARKDDEIACECRGLILDEDLNVLCRPFDRFFNYGELGTKDFDFSNCYIAEKADGSLTKVWFNKKTDRWEIGTRGTAYAEANHVFGLKTDWTFREAILDAMNFTEDQFQQCMCQPEFHKSCTYIMEYTSPYNRIVTRYEKPEMVLLGVRSNITGIEAHERGITQWCDILCKYKMNIRVPKRYYAHTADEVASMVDALVDLQEGFVVKNLITGQRVKIKNSLYVKVHAARGNGTPTLNNLMEMVLTGEKDEFLVHFAEYEHFFVPIDNALHQLNEEAVRVYETNEQLESQKDFALAVKDTNVAAICFKARKEKVTAHRAFETMELNQQMKILEKFL